MSVVDVTQFVEEALDYLQKQGFIEETKNNFFGAL